MIRGGEGESQLMCYKSSVRLGSVYILCGIVSNPRKSR